MTGWRSKPSGDTKPYRRAADLMPHSLTPCAAACLDAVALSVVGNYGSHAVASQQPLLAMQIRHCQSLGLSEQIYSAHGGMRTAKLVGRRAILAAQELDSLSNDNLILALPENGDCDDDIYR